MASTAYKGLTIRIGADTTSLQSALKATNRTIQSTQSHLRQVQRMLKMDGSNVEAQAKQMQLVQTRARALSERLGLLQREIKQLGSDGSLRKLAAETDDVAGHAERCRQRYAEVCDSLARLKHDAALKGQASDMERLASEIRAGNDLLAEQRKRVAEMGDAPGADKLVASIREQQREVTKLERQYRKLENGAKNAFSGIEGVDATIERMRELGVWSRDLEREYRQLADAHARAFADNEAAKQLSQLDQLKMDAMAAKAEVRSLASEFVMLARAGASKNISAEFEKARADILQCDAAAKKLDENISKMQGAFSTDRWMAGLRDELTSAMGRKIDVLREKASLLKAQIAELDNLGLRGMTDGGQGAERALERVTAEAKEVAAALMDAQGRLKLLNEDLDRTGEGSSEFSEVKARANAAATEVAELEARMRALRSVMEGLSRGVTLNDLVADMYKVEAEARKAEESVERLGKAGSVAHGTMQQLGWSMYSTVTPALTMFGYSAIRAAEDIDAAYRDMRKTIEGSEQQFEQLRSNAIDYSRSHYTSADDILEIEAMGGQLGIAADNVEAFATVISNLDIATSLDCDQASEQLGQLSSILTDMREGIEGGDDMYARFGDALVRLGNNSATLETNIMDVTKRIGSMGSILGMSTPEILAWATAVASTGQGSESAGTAISKTMSDIESAVSAGGDKLEAFASVANMTAEEFRSMWESDPSSAMQAFVKGLADIEARGGSADSTLKDLKITSVRQKQALLGLSQTIGNLDNYMQMSNDAFNGASDVWGRAGDAAREADAKTQGFSGAIQLLRNNADALGAEMGDSLTGVLTDLSEIVSGLTSAYSSLPDWAKTLVDIGVAAAAAAGPLTVFGNGIGKALEEMTASAVAANGQAVVSMLQSIGIEAEASSRGVAALSTGIKGLKFAGAAAGIMLAVTAISELVSYTVDLYEKQTAGARAAEAMGDALSAYSSIGSEAASSTEELASAVDAAAMDAAESLNQVTEEAAETAESIKSIADTANTDVAKAMNLQEAIFELMELGETCGLTAGQQAELVALVSQFNEVTGANLSVVDAATGSLSRQRGEIEALIESWADQTKAIAKQNALQEAINQLTNWEVEMAKAQKALDDLEAAGRLYRDVSGTNWADSNGIDKVLTDAGKEATQALASATEGWEAYKDEVDALTDSMGMESITAEDAAHATAQWGDAAQEAAGDAEELAEEAQTAGEALQSFLDSGEFEWSGRFQAACEQAGWSIDEVAEAMGMLGMDTDKLKEIFGELEAPMSNAFEKMETESGKSLSEVRENLEANRDAYKEWYDDLATLEQNATTEQQRRYVDYLLEAGVGYSDLVEKYAGDIGAFLKDAELYDVDAMADSFNEARFRNNFDAFIVTISEAMEQLTGMTHEEAQKFASSIGEMSKGLEDPEAFLAYVDGIKNTLGPEFGELAASLDWSAMVEKWREGGSEACNAYLEEFDSLEQRQAALVQNVKNGLVSFSEACNQAASGAEKSSGEVVSYLKKPLVNLPDELSKAGLEGGRGVAKGMGDSASEAEAEANKIKEATSHAGDYKDSAYGDGYSIGSNIAKGVNASLEVAREAVNRLKAIMNVTIKGPTISRVGVTYGQPTTVTPQRRSAMRMAAPANYSDGIAAMAAPTAYTAPEAVEAMGHIQTFGISYQREVANGLAARIELENRSRSDMPGEVARAVAKALSGTTVSIDPRSVKGMGATYNTTNIEGVTYDDGSAIGIAVGDLARKIKLERRS